MGELLHRERLWPSWPTWLLLVLAAAFGAATGYVGGPGWAAVGAAALVGLVAAWLVSSAVPVEVWSTGGLRAGRARVPAAHLARGGEGEDGGVAARGQDARWLRGPGLDARTFLCLRGWVDPVVLVVLDDPDDPTPSWLVSTRHPERVLAAVREAARASAAA